MKKMIHVFAAAIGLTVTLSMTVFAGQWQRNAQGWWYQNDNGTYPRNTWQYIGGAWYCFDGSGYMLHDVWAGNYYLGSSGAMLVNTVTPDGYRVGADGKWDGKPSSSSSNAGSSSDIATLNMLHGKWYLDPDYIYKANGVSLRTLFGTGIKYGNEMVFDKNNMHFSQYAGVGYGGEGTFSVSGDRIKYSIRDYEYGAREAGELLIRQINGKTYIVEDFYDGYKLYWVK